MISKEKISRWSPAYPAIQIGKPASSEFLWREDWQALQFGGDGISQRIAGPPKHKVNCFWELRARDSQVRGSSQPSDEWRQRCPIQEIVWILLLDGEQRYTKPGRRVKQRFKQGR